MKILHIVYTYEPDPLGGTEVYVKQLCVQLDARGVESAIAAPGKEWKVSVSGTGNKIYRFPFDQHPPYAFFYGIGDPVALESFKKIVEDFSPDLVNFHSVSPANSQLLFEYCKNLGLPVILTLHTPAMVCQRGDLLRFGDQVCHNFMDVGRCTRCFLHKMTSSHVFAASVAGVSSFLRADDIKEIKGRHNLALYMHSLMEVRIEQSRRIFDLVDKIVCPAKWVSDILLQNKVPPSKLVFSRQGITIQGPVPVKKKTFSKKFIFLGRLDPLKGVHVLLNAFKKIPDADLRLDLYVVLQAEDAYVKKIRQLVAADSRVRLLKSVASEQVVRLIAEYDVLLVPSQWLETGPLVVLESFAARTPVLGSALGSIGELIQDGQNGFLVEDYRSPFAWSAKIEQICQNPQLLTEVQERIVDPKTMSQVADEMVSVKKPVPPVKKTFSKRFVFLGRLDPFKGVQVLLNAFKKVPDPEVRLDLYVVTQLENDYVKKIRQLAAADGRVRLLPAVASEQVVNLIAEYDVILVPSQILETGPLVVLEAFAARTPVLGSALGSIAELIQDGQNGFLVKDYRLPGAWTEKINQICQNPKLIAEVQERIVDPKTMSQVADERVSVYQSLLKHEK